MAFSDKLEVAMREAGMTAAELSRRAGIGKSSISQYLSGASEPGGERKALLSSILGAELDARPAASEKRPKKIPKLSITKAARLMGVSERTIRRGLQDGVFPWGYAVHGEGGKWVYFINARRFAEIEKVEVEDE